MYRTQSALDGRMVELLARTYTEVQAALSTVRFCVGFGVAPAPSLFAGSCPLGGLYVDFNIPFADAVHNEDLI